jgi:hypothetical protein
VSGEAGTGVGAVGGDAGAGGADDTGGAAGTGGGGTGGSVIDPCPSDIDPGDPPMIAADCDPTATIGTGTAVPIDSNMPTEGLIAVTPDELTIAWFSAVGAAGAYLFADRASEDDDFDPSVQGPPYMVGLSPDGLRLVTLASDGTYLEHTRAARGSVFGSPSEGAFSTINADARASRLLLADCVISSDDRTLYYTAAGADTEDTLRVSRRTGTGDWPVGDEVTQCELKSYGSLGPHPTGVSDDGLTLFFFDSSRGTTRAGWRETPTSPFVWFRDLGEQGAAQPNTACNRLYYSSGTTTAGILVAPVQ